ncbi:MAG: hypothetical protein OEY99_04075 [Aigarchaeota archaeon]|nr:hypothetical protein [Aigarchaeota archaeon]
MEVFVNLPVELEMRENTFNLIEKRASKVKLVFLELEGDNPLTIPEWIFHENGDVTFGPEIEVDLNPEMLDNLFNEIKNFYWTQSNHKLEFTSYQFLGKFVRENLSENSVDSYVYELIESKQSRIVQEENEYVGIIVVVDDCDTHFDYCGANYGRLLRDDWNLMLFSVIRDFHTNTATEGLLHEIGHSSFIINASDWYNRPTPEEYEKRPFSRLVDYDLYGHDIYGLSPRSFTAANKVCLAGLEYTTITGTPPYERTITLTPTPELTNSTAVYKIPLEFVSYSGVRPYLRSYVFNLRNDVDGGQGVYIQEIVEFITSSFDHIYVKPYWSTIVPRKTVSEMEELITIPLYLSNRTQTNDGRVTSISDEFVDVDLVDEEWDENLRSATIRVKVKKQNLSPPTYKSKIYLTEFNGVRIAYVNNEGFTVRPTVFERNGRVSFYPFIEGGPKHTIWVFTPIDNSIKYSDEVDNLDQKYNLMPVPEGVIEKLNQDFDLNLSEVDPFTGENITLKLFEAINVFIKEELEDPIIGFVYFDTMSESFKGIFADEW